MSTSTPVAVPQNAKPIKGRAGPAGTPEKRPWSAGRISLYFALSIASASFLAPLLWTFYTSLRPFEETAARGYFSVGGALNFNNYSAAWTQADLPLYYFNTFLITVPAVIIVLALATMVAFVVSRYSFKVNLPLLMLFTAGNLLPQQVIITPLYRMYLEIPLPGFLSESGVMYDSFFGIIMIHVAFQLGFCTFVLSNYMKTLPKELSEAARVDGASAWQQYSKVILPLTRPALAALGTLQFTWIYNDFFWALVLMNSGDKRPITSALSSLSGLYFTNNNLVAAGSLLAAVPTLVIYLILQKQFISGLTLGSTKG